MGKILLLCLMACSLSTLSFAEDEEGGKSNRIDFGNSYVNGQSIKSGAVYLMNRKKNKITSMLKRRESYRSEILDEYPEFRSETFEKQKQASSY